MLKLSRILLANVVMIIVYGIFDFLTWHNVLDWVQVTFWSPFVVGYRIWTSPMFWAAGWMPNFTFIVFLISIIVNMIILRNLQRAHTQ